MSVEELIKELNSLPLDQRMKVVDAVLDADDSWIPESFREAMDDFDKGRIVDMETALNEPPPLCPR